MPSPATLHLWACNFTIGFWCLMNWLGLLEAVYTQRKFSFAPPYLCGIAAALALLAHPQAEYRLLAWLPLLADPSIGLVVIWLGLRRLKI